MAERKRRIVDWENFSKWEKAVMVVMLPIFAIVAGVEHIIAKVTGMTYNEVNIIVYYLLIPLSWAVIGPPDRPISPGRVSTGRCPATAACSSSGTR